MPRTFFPRSLKTRAMRLKRCRCAAQIAAVWFAQVFAEMFDREAAVTGAILCEHPLYPGRQGAAKKRRQAAIVQIC
jgi:hypothetical protein